MYIHVFFSVHFFILLFASEMDQPSSTSNVNSSFSIAATPGKVALIDWNNFISGGPRKSRLNKDIDAVLKADSNSEGTLLKLIDPSSRPGHSAVTSDQLTQQEPKKTSLKGPAGEVRAANYSGSLIGFSNFRLHIY